MPRMAGYPIVPCFQRGQCCDLNTEQCRVVGWLPFVANHPPSRETASPFKLEEAVLPGSGGERTDIIRCAFYQ